MPSSFLEWVAFTVLGAPVAFGFLLVLYLIIGDLIDPAEKLDRWKFPRRPITPPPWNLWIEE